MSHLRTKFKPHPVVGCQLPRPRSRSSPLRRAITACVPAGINTPGSAATAPLPVRVAVSSLVVHAINRMEEDEEEGEGSGLSAPWSFGCSPAILHAVVFGRWQLAISRPRPRPRLTRQQGENRRYRQAAPTPQGGRGLIHASEEVKVSSGVLGCGMDDLPALHPRGRWPGCHIPSASRHRSHARANEGRKQAGPSLIRRECRGAHSWSACVARGRDELVCAERASILPLLPNDSIQR